MMEFNLQKDQSMSTCRTERNGTELLQSMQNCFCGVILQKACQCIRFVRLMENR